MVSQIILAFFPTLSHLHVHGEGKNVFIIINVAVFALYWPKVLAASAGRVERVRGGIPIQGPGLATTDNEWSGFWVLIRGIVDNEEAATQARGPVTGPPLVTLSNYIQYQDMWGMRGLLSIMDSDKPEIFWLTFLAVPGTPPHVTTLSAAENGGFERMGQGKILLHSPHISVRILREAPHIFSLFRFRPFAFILPW